MFYSNLEYLQKLEETLAAKLGLPALKSGNIVIRDERDWRTNEKWIDFIWIVTISRSFVGFGGLFGVSFREHSFRDQHNPAEEVNGVFTSGQEGIEQIFINNTTEASFDIADFFKLNLIQANPGIALDGVVYEVRIIAPNIDSYIHVFNSNTPEWQAWEKDLWDLGRRFAKKSENYDMIRLFEW